MTGWRHPIAMAAAAALLDRLHARSGPDFSRPTSLRQKATPESLAPRPPRLLPMADRRRSFVQSVDIPGQWWALYHSTELQLALIEEARAPTPISTRPRRRCARRGKNFFAAQGGLFPSLSGNVGGQQQQTTGFQQGFGLGHPDLRRDDGLRGMSPTRSTSSAAFGD